MRGFDVRMRLHAAHRTSQSERQGSRESRSHPVSRSWRAKDFRPAGSGAEDQPPGCEMDPLGPLFDAMQQNEREPTRNACKARGRRGVQPTTPRNAAMKTLAASLLVLTALSGCQRSATRCPKTPAASSAPLAAPTGDTAHILREPVLRLTESGGWGQGLQRAGIPEFTLYADGLVIFARGEGPSATAMQVRLSAEDTAALVDRAHAALGALPRQTELVTHTDASLATIGVTHGGRIYAVGMYGFAEAAADAPVAFTELRGLLQSWDHADAEAWTPDELEIALYRHDDLEGSEQAWPSELPRPPAGAREPSPRPMGGRSKTMIQQPIRYRVSGDLEAALESTLPDPKGQDGVVWNGSTWLVRHTRVVPARTWFW